MPVVPQLAEVRFLANPVTAWMVAGAIALLVAGALFVFRGLLAHRLEVIARRTETRLDDLGVDLVRRLRVYFIAAVAVAAGSSVLTLPDAARDAVRVAGHLALLFQVGAWGNGLIAFWLRELAVRRGEDPGASMTLAAFGVLGRFAMWTILVLFALRNAFGFDITALITGLGIGGVAVALAVQNILGDLFAALSIVVDKPFVVGDTISVDAFTGTVEKVGLKTTRLRGVDGEQLVFSNADLLKSRLRNFRRMVERRTVFTIGLTYDTPPELAARVPVVVREIIERVPRTRFDRCHFRAFGDSALQYEVAYWVLSPDFLDYLDALHAVNLGILERFGPEGLRFAFPTRTIVAVPRPDQETAPRPRSSLDAAR